MSLSPRSSSVKPESSSGLHHFTPDDLALSSRAAPRRIPAALREAAPNRLRYRVRLVWSDVATPNRRREEILEFADARKAIDLIRRVSESPERPLLSVRLEAFARPRWCDVDMDFLRWRAAQRDRRDQIRQVMARRAAERIARDEPR